MRCFPYIAIVFAGGLVKAQTGLELQLASAARQRTALEGMAVSLRLQRASVQKQARIASVSASAFFVTMESDRLAPDKPTASCDPLPVFEARSMVESAARNAGIDANLLQAVAQQESAFRPCALSNKGAQGVMQLMPETAMELGVQNPFDAAESLTGGATLLRRLMDRYSGDLNRVLGAYNAGAARVDAADGVPRIPETLQYVEKILGKLP